ncbi:hypothetical protein ACFVHB_02700 [Kitasatospora sp. NPDC127111]|uniref:hypothetical protein n=1 Tax=Kitasatospora sp. NPDC127111 TaxID=3345363 RepID=UPI00363AF0A2
MIATEVDSPDLDRRHRQELMACAPLAVPGPAARSVGGYPRGFQLVYGAFDFAVSPTGQRHFLEGGPHGRWAWQPPGTTEAIGRAMADRLQQGLAA